MEKKKTHTEVKNPQISVSRLADYMAASEQTKRAIAQTCRYRPIARIVQHDEAKAIISKFLLSEKKDPATLKARAQDLRNKLADSDFESDVNNHNADYVDRFFSVTELLALPDAQILPTKKFATISLEGVRVSFAPNLILRRLTKTNKIKTGALMLRYAKRKTLDEKVAAYQSSFVFGYFREVPGEDQAEPEKGLCVTLDAYTGAAHVAPGNAAYLFKEMRAACASIAERWPAIKIPKNAVL